MQVGDGYWASYERNLPSMLPASQVLLGGVQGYVAEAAVPRFVTKDGDQNFLRQWE